jgi:hypothetical protein
MMFMTQNAIEAEKAYFAVQSQNSPRTKGNHRKLQPG